MASLWLMLVGPTDMQLIAKTLMLTAVTLGVWLYLVRYSERSGAVKELCRVGYVYDGDTVALDCGGEEQITARVRGLDAPETKSPGCAEELAHGTLATERLRALIAAADEVTVKIFGKDKYNRELITLRLDGLDVAKTLVREGLATAYSGGQRVNWCEKLGAA